MTSRLDHPDDERLMSLTPQTEELALPKHRSLTRLVFSTKPTNDLGTANIQSCGCRTGRYANCTSNREASPEDVKHTLDALRVQSKKKRNRRSCPLSR